MEQPSGGGGASVGVKLEVQPTTQEVFVSMEAAQQAQQAPLAASDGNGGLPLGFEGSDQLPSLSGAALGAAVSAEGTRPAGAGQEGSAIAAAASSGGGGEAEAASGGDIPKAAEGSRAAAGSVADVDGQDGLKGGLEALHDEVVRFAAEAGPTTEESANKEAALSQILLACQEGLRDNKRIRVQLFGSGAHGISLRGSDLDVVVTNFITPMTVSGAFTAEQKELVGHSLRSISNALMRAQALVRRPLIIYNARVPVAKAEFANGTRADISIGSADGPKAAQFLLEQQGRFPMLRPLCLVVKGLLLDAGLHEAGRGGLSTWSLANMALALLLEQDKAGCGTDAAGHLLLGFLKYFGRVFDYASQAVAVGRGGIVPKSEVPLAGGSVQQQQQQQLDLSRAPRLCVEDPLTGRDVASGSHKVHEVAQVFRDAAAKLDLLLRAPDPPPGGYLPLLFTLPPAGRGSQQGGDVAGGGAALTGVKRAREGPGAGVSAGPRPMLKQMAGGMRTARGHGEAHPFGAQIRPSRSHPPAALQQPRQAAGAAAAGGAHPGLQGAAVLLPPGSTAMLPAGRVVHPGLAGGLSALLLPAAAGQEGMQRQLQASHAGGAAGGLAGGLVLLQQQPFGRQQGLLGGGVGELAGPGALGSAGLLQGGGFVPGAGQQGGQQLVLTTLGGGQVVLLAQPGGAEQQQQQQGQPDGGVYYQ